MDLGHGKSEALPYDDMLADTPAFWLQALSIRNGPAVPGLDMRRFSMDMSDELAVNRLVRGNEA